MEEKYISENTEITETIKKNIEDKQYNEFKKNIVLLNSADAAALLDEVFEDSDTLTALMLFRMLPKSTAAEVFSYFDVDIQHEFIKNLSAAETTQLLNDMYADDIADMLEEVPANVVARLLSGISPEDRKAVNELLKYQDDSAGSIMTVEFMSLLESFTVKQALERIRKVAVDKETVNTCFILGENRILTGIITLRKLIITDENALISDIMDENVIYVTTSTDREAVADMFQKYDLTSMPVVDSEHRLVGIITIDDVVDIIREEATEDIEIMAAITPSERPYLKTGVFRTYLQRIPWLLLLMISATVTSKIMQSFESALAACVALTAFVPMLTDTGGNSGSQASVTIIRGLSLGEIQFSDIFKVILKELGVASLCGLSLSLVNFGKMMLFDVGHGSVTAQIALTVSLTLFITVIIAKFVGCILPIVAKPIKLDPAVVASPFITTIVDALALIVYFTIASSLLGLNA